MVHQEQRLWSHRADVARADNNAWIGEVKRLEDLRQRIAESGNVNASTRLAVIKPIVGGQAWLERGAAAVIAQFTAHKQYCIANAFGIQPAAIRVCKQPVFRIGIRMSR